MSPLCKSSYFFSFVFLFLITTTAIDLDLTEETAQTFIVRVQNDLKPSVFSDVEQWYASTLQSLNSNLQTIQTGGDNQQFDTSGLLHVYKTVFHGFSARLTPKQAQNLVQNRPEVLAVLPDKLRQLHTTRSPEFLGISSQSNPTGLLKESNEGSDVVIGVLDTGIWPERRSFHDEGLGPIPSHWRGECIEGEKFTNSHCNNKIIGARYFIAGYESKMGGINATEELRSPRDGDGHGTHTASTAAGRAVVNASLFGLAQGIAVGIAPKARLAVYKICWKKGCTDSDILAGIDKAVEDGVDVISLSVGGGAVAFNLDPIAIGSFAAMERGILVSASAGNDGPTAMSVTNLAPWITTVGASTIDRNFPADLILGDGQVLKGASLYQGNRALERTYFPLVYAGNISAGSPKGFGPIGWYSAGTCMPDSLDNEQAKGKIVLCDRGGNARVAKGEVVQKAGGAGVLVANMAPLGGGLTADAHLIPGLSVTQSAGDKVRAYINSNPNPKARMVFRGTEMGSKPAPVVASFSSRGPNGETPYVLKPDIIAPGVNILAAWPDDVPPTELSSDSRRSDFNIVSGTSMSCPHASGIAALLKGAHPDWSPAMIRSAMMTTATMHDNAGNPLLDEQSYNESSIWAMGAGQVNPERAVDPGLVYDLTIEDYVNFLCAANYSRQAIRQIARRGDTKCKRRNNEPWNLNYPAITVVYEPTESSNFEAAVTRTVTYVGDGASSYNVTVTNPKGVAVSVKPSKLDFEMKGQKRSYVVVMKGEALKVKAGNAVTEWGKIVWSDGRRHQVTSPLVVMWRNMY